MNIIEALQALKDGLKIRKTGWSNSSYYIYLTEGGVCNQIGEHEEIIISNLYHLADVWELYTEPLKLTPEEIKALKLARDCGFRWIHNHVDAWSDSNQYEAWLTKEKYASHSDHQDCCARWIPSLAILNSASCLTEEPMSISELLKDEV